MQLTYDSAKSLTTEQIRTGVGQFLSVETTFITVTSNAQRRLLAVIAVTVRVYFSGSGAAAAAQTSLLAAKTLTISGVQLSVVGAFVLTPDQTQIPTPTPAPSTQDALPIGAIVASVLVGIGGVGTAVGLLLYYSAKKTTAVTPEKAKKDPETAKHTKSAFRDVMDVKILTLEKRMTPDRYLEAPSREYFHYQKSQIISVAPTK